TLAVAATAALALAALPAAPRADAATIYACFKKRTGAFRIVGKRSICRRGERKLSWNLVGPQGPSGPGGATGPPGPNGVNGVNGVTGFTSTLPTGKTEEGIYAVTRTGNSSGLPAWAGVSFVIPLAAAIPVANVSLIPPGGGLTLPCPGSSRNPQAASGHLCVYEAANFNTSGPLVFNPDTESGEEGAGPFGFVVRFRPTVSTMDWGGYGTWAVTG
ncbi:MAG: Collagen triple helix repeat protein, partial [Solirubrobacterales bacterium]|nr:Collagen triple helix repeat protein [Solirubrobacterales bacterium]